MGGAQQHGWLLAFLVLIVGLTAAVWASDWAEAAVCLTGFPGGVCTAEDAVVSFSALLAPFTSVDIFVVAPAEACEQVKGLFDLAAWQAARGDGEPKRPLRVVNVDCIDNDVAAAEARPLVAPQASLQREYAGDEASKPTGASFEDEGANLREMVQMGDWLRCGTLVTGALALGAQYRWMVKARIDSLYYAFPSREALVQSGHRELWTAFMPMPHHFFAWQDGCFVGRTEAVLEMLRYPLWLQELLHGDASLRADFLKLEPYCAVWPEGGHKSRCRVLFTGSFLQEMYVALSTDLLVRSYRGVCFEKTQVAASLQEGGPQRCLHSRQPTCAHYHPVAHQDAAVREGYAHSGVGAGTGATVDVTQFALRGDADYDPIFAARLVVTLARDVAPGGHITVLHVGCRRGDMLAHLARWPMVSALGSDASPLAAELQPGMAWHQEWPHALGNAGNAEDHFHCGLEVGAEIRHAVPAPLGLALAQGCLRMESCVGYRRFADGGGEVLLGDAAITGPGEDCAWLGGDRAAWHGNLSSNWASGQADWIVALDIGGDLAQAVPGSWREGAYLEGLARSARGGLVLSWGRPAAHVPGEPILGERARPQTQWAPARSSEELAGFFEPLGFAVDEAGTASLRLFSGLVCCQHRQHDVLVLRRRRPIEDPPCDVQLHEAFPSTRTKPCELGVTFGCVNTQFIWAAQGCTGIFRRGEGQVLCMSHASGDAYTECRLESALGNPAAAAHVSEPPRGSATSFECSSPAVDDALRHPRLVHGMSAAAASNAYDAMDLLAWRAGVAWEGDCFLNALYYRVLACALAPPFRLRDGFAFSALRRDITLLLGRATSAAATPAQWRRLVVGLRLLAARAAEESAALLPPELAEAWLQTIAGQGAEMENMEEAEALLEAGLQLTPSGDVVPAQSSLGHYLRRLLRRVL